MTPRWWQKLVSRKSPRARRGARPSSGRRRPGVPLWAELLEDRITPDSGGASGVLTASGNLALNPSGQNTGFSQQVIPNVKVQLIFLTDSTNNRTVPAATQTAIQNYFTTITADGYISTLLAQYGSTLGLPAIGNGSVGVVDTTASASPNTTDLGTDNATHPAYTDAKLQSIIQGEINNGHSAASDGKNNLYFIFTPAGDIVDGGGGATSANTFLGYHSAFVDTNGTNPDYYAVIPDQTPNGVNLNEANLAGLGLGLNAVQGETTTSSHELAEAITDCIPVQGWVDPNLGGTGEVGDQAANEYYIQDGRAVQYEWSNAIIGAARAPGSGAADLFINQVSPPAVPVATTTSVPVASFTTANTALTTGNFTAKVFSFDSTGHGFVLWTVTSITGGNGHFVVNAKPNTAVSAGTYGKLFSQQEGLYVIVQDTLAGDASKIDGPPTSLKYAPYVVGATAPMTYTADSGSGVNNFVLKKNTGTGNFELRDNGNLVFTQPIALTSSIVINGDPAVPGVASASVDNSLTIDYSGGTFTTPVTFDGGPGSGTHTLTFTGGTFTNETYTYTGAAAGNVVLGGQTVTFSHTTALADSDTVTNDTFNLPSAGNTVTFQESGNGATPLELLSGGTFPTTQFANPSGSATIQAAASTTNTINVAALPDLHSALTINGNTGSDTVNLNGALTLGNAGGNTGNLSVTAKVISVVGVIDSTGGTSGTQTLNAGTTITTSGAGLLKAKALALTAGGTIGSAGTPLAINAGTLTTDTHTGNGNQFLSDGGTVKVTATNGLNAGTGTITLAGGTFLIDSTNSATSPVAVSSGVTLGGTGSLGGAVTVDGTLSPGDSGAGALGTGSLTIKADGTLLEELGGTAAGTFDVVNVNGAATLGGTITVNLINGFTPSSGNSFQILTYTSETGDFTTQNGFNLSGGLTVKETINANTLVLSVQAQAGPTVTGVSATTANGTYGAGAVISITVTFSTAVTVTGTPQLALNSGGTASYSSGSGTSTLTFTYTVAAGQTTSGAKLDYASATALTLNGGTIKDGSNNNANLALATPGAAGSLGASKSILIDAVAPTVTGVSSTTANGTYGVGSVITITVSWSKAVVVTGTPQLALNSGGTASYSSGSGTSTLTFTYTVVAGQNTSKLDYTSTGALTLNGGTITDTVNSPNAANVTLATPGAAGSLGVNKSIVIDTTAPTVTGVSSTAANGTYSNPASLSITISFNKAVVVTGTPRLALSSGGTATYSSGSGTTTLTFTYNIGANDSTAGANLDAASATALTLNGGTITDTVTNPNAANLTVPVSPAANSLAKQKSIIIAPVLTGVTNVSATTANGTYGAGATISITVTFSAAVTVAGTPQLALSDGATASYSSGSGTATLTFTYTVAAGQTTGGANLDYASATALTLNGGTIKDGNNNNVILTLAAPGAAGSLGASKSIKIDAVAPTVTGVSSTTANGTYAIGSVITITVSWSKAVQVTGTPLLALNSGGTASYSSGSGTSTLTFTYTVATGDTTHGGNLDVASAGALTLNGGTITDTVTNPNAANLTVPVGSLSDAKSLVIDGTTPTVAVNATLGVTSNGTPRTITSAFLAASDPDDGAAALTFTVVTAPAHGTLKDGNTVLHAGSTFTQADINSGLVTYSTTDSVDVNDGFTFTVQDAASNKTSLQTFSIIIAVPPAVTGNPANQAVTPGQTATFTASASGTPAPSVQWQVSTDGGATWTAILGATSTTLTVANVQVGQNGDMYEAVFSNAGGSVTTTAATLFVQADITAQTVVTAGPFNTRTDQQAVTIRNKSQIGYRGPLALVLNFFGFARNQGISLEGAVINGKFVAAHKASDGRYYVEVVPMGGVFNPGQTLGVTLQFSANPEQSYTTNVLLGL